jgi:hypothetical protein
VSNYVFRGSLIGTQSFQPSVNATYGALAVNVWANTPLLNRYQIAGQPSVEIDPSASYTIGIVDGLNVQPGFTSYNYSQSTDGEGFYRHTFEPNLALNYTVDGITLTPKAYYDVVLRGPTYELNGAYVVPLKSFGTELDFLGTVGTYKQDDVVHTSKQATLAWGNYWVAGVTAPFKIDAHSQVSLGWAYANGWDSYSKTGKARQSLNTASVGRGVTSVSYNYSF